MDINTLTEVCLEKTREREALLPNCKTAEQKKQWEDESLDKYRCDLEPYIWQYFMFNYGPKLDEFWNKHEFSIKSKYAWVIIERRCHPNLWFLLRNIAWAAPTFSLYIFCSDENIEFIKALLGKKAKNVHIISWFSGFVSREEGKNQYNLSLKLPKLYEIIDAEYLISVQTDTYLRHKIPETIFVDDYYGCPWFWKRDTPGGGGITIRKIKSMIDLCNKTYDLGMENEDSWIGNKIIEFGYTFPPLEIRENIFSENYPVPDPIGVHQFWTFIENFEIKNPPKFKEYLETYLKIYLDE